MNRLIALLCGTLRLIHAVLLRTYFNPDEYWQCLEPAHLLAFSYGHRTWEWAAGLRGYLHPALFALLYKVLQVAMVDTSWTVAKAPQVMQAGFAAMTDLYVYKLTLLLFGQNIARWTLLCQMTNWFNAYCLVRTYSNSFEALCTVMGVFYWLKASSTHLKHFVVLPHSSQPLPLQDNSGSAHVNQPVASPHSSQQSAACQQQGHLKQPSRVVSNASPSLPIGEEKNLMTSRQKALWAAAVGVLFRPSSVLFWAPLGVHELMVCEAKWHFMLEAALIGGVTLLMGSCIDRIGYGRWVLVPWEFAKFNLFQAGSAMYGSHPWHWNFTQGVPTITVTLLPLAVWGVYLSHDRLQLAALVLWSLLMYSLPAHKEFRFLLPALLLLMPYCGVGLNDLAGRWGQQSATADTLLHQVDVHRNVCCNELNKYKVAVGARVTDNALIQAAISNVRHTKLQPQQHSGRGIFSLDRSAVDKARQLSRLLDEAPQEGGCPCMVSTDVMPQSPSGSKSRICPFSSDRAPVAQAKENSILDAESAVCPSIGGDPSAVVPALDAASPECSDSTCLTSSRPDGLLKLQQTNAAAKCPFRFGQGVSSQLLASPQPALAPAAAQSGHDQPDTISDTPPGAEAAQAEHDDQLQIDAMTDEALKEYEQAFAVDPNEAMLQAYAALLADKVAEADRESDDTPHCNGHDHRPGQPTLPAHGQPPSGYTNDATFPEALGGQQCPASDASPSRLPQASAQGTSAELAEAASVPAAGTAVPTAGAAAAHADRMMTDSSGPCAADANSKAAVKAVFSFQEVWGACQQSMSRIQSCCEYLQQQPLGWHMLMTTCFGIQLVMTLYFSSVHQRGQIDVMHYLAHEAQTQPSLTVLFLTPCHATPWFSHVHANISMDFLDCSPPGWAEATRCLNTPGCSMRGWKTPDMHSVPSQHEYDMFKDDPLQVLQSRWNNIGKQSMPTHLVMFQDLVPAVSRYIAEQGFALRKTFFNCHVQVDAGSRICLWKLTA